MFVSRFTNRYDAFITMRKTHHTPRTYTQRFIKVNSIIQSNNKLNKTNTTKNFLMWSEKYELNKFFKCKRS